eukprot:CCRYP_007926-RA/>CCRYP_007926-RA protein AED:0.04 eAED:0.04 QI:381/1/1/1/0.5/0.33/3/2170/853
MTNMTFRNNHYEPEHDKDFQRPHRQSFVNRLRTHTDSELSINSTSLSYLNVPNLDDSTLLPSGRNFRRSSHIFGGLHSSTNSGYYHNHHHHTVAGEVISGHLPYSSITSMSSSFSMQNNLHHEKNSSPIARSMRRFRSSTWDAGGVHSSLTSSLKLSPRLVGSGVTSGNEFFEEDIPFPNVIDDDDDDKGEEEDLSFTTSSENSLEGDLRHESAEDIIGFPASCDRDEIEGETPPQSSLYYDERGPTHAKNNLQPLGEQVQQFTADSNEPQAGLKRSAPQHSTLSSGKSSSSDDGTKRNVTFSADVDVQQYKQIVEMDTSGHSNSIILGVLSEKLDPSSEDKDSEIYHEDIRSTSPPSYHSTQEKYEPQTGLLSNNRLLRRLNPFRDLSWSLIGSYIVRYAPCFFCMKKLGVSATDRNVVMRLNILCAFYAIVQLGLGFFLFLVTLLGEKITNDYYDVSTDDSESATAKNAALVLDGNGSEPIFVSPDLWNLSLFVYILTAVSLVLLIASYFAQRAIRNVNLVRSVRFMWTLFWLLPIQIFLMIGLFDYYRVMDVYIKHWWDEPSMAWFRSKFCDEGTAMEKCVVPVDGGEEFDNEEEWCEAYYNATDCRGIRDEAQAWCEVFSYVFFTTNGVLALLLVASMWVTLSVLQGIISLPIVQRSKESNIPLWLSFPISGCFLIGVILLFGPSTVTSSFQDLYMIGLTYLVSGGAFTLAAIVGISLKLYTVLNKRQKKCKQGLVLVFIVTMIVTILAVATIFVTSIIYSFNIIKIPTNEYHQIACMLDTGGSCTGCDSNTPINVCPEWSEEDVVRVMKTIMKQSATVSATFLVYALVTIRYGFLLLSHVNSYQIDYV